MGVQSGCTQIGCGDHYQADSETHVMDAPRIALSQICNLGLNFICSLSLSASHTAIPYKEKKKG